MPVSCGFAVRSVTLLTVIDAAYAPQARASKANTMTTGFSLFIAGHLLQH